MLLVTTGEIGVSLSYSFSLCVPIFHSKTPFAKAKFETDDIVEAFVEGVKRFTSYKKIDKVLDIPKVLLKSNGEYCKAAEIFYELKVEAILSGFHKGMKIFFPIVIGSIPLIVDRPRPVDRKGSLPNPSSSSVFPLRSGCSSPLTPLLELGMLESREFKAFCLNFIST